MTRILANAANWKFIVPSLLLFIICIYLFQKSEAKMSLLAGEATPMIDLRSNYDAVEINDFFTKIQAEGRAEHRFATGIVDMIFPFAYGGLFILLSAFFLKKITSPDSNWMYLSLFPILLMVVDYIENFNTLELLDSYPNLSEEKVANASSITGIKSTLTSISMLLPLLLGVVWTGKWFLNRNKKV